MLRFNNDYNQTAHEAVLKIMTESAAGNFAGYGADECCEKAAELIRDLVKAPTAAVHFIPGATQTNLIVIAAALSPIQSVICADTGHINAHEAASIENTGHKIIALPNTDGKITAAQIEGEAAKYYQDGEAEYLTEPRLVYISFPAEFGTLYSLTELQAIAAVCRKYKLILFVDGARMGYGLGADGNDVTLPDLAALADAFYIGGTKCGCMFGEALVITDKNLQRKFKTYMKQNGAVLAKGWLLGMQFYALLKDGLYFTITRRADELAMRLQAAFRAKGIKEAVVSQTNQQFVVLTAEQKAQLAKEFIFEEMGELTRFCTSWGTKEEDVQTLIAAIERL